MVEIHINCPICSKKRILQISENAVKENPKGILTVNIINDSICPHNLVVYFDMNLNVRDIFTTDFTVQIPEMPKNDIEELDFKKIEAFNTDLIKINLYPISLIYILKSCFYNKKVLILNELEFLKPFLETFFDLIFGESFTYFVLINSTNEYNVDKKNFKDFIIIDGKNIVRDKQKILNLKKNKIEKLIIQKFFTEYDSKTSLIILRNEIRKAFNFSKSIIEIVQNLEQKEKININIIIGKLQQVYKVNVSRYYLDFLIEIIENYFKVKVPIIYENILSFV